MKSPRIRVILVLVLSLLLGAWWCLRTPSKPASATQSNAGAGPRASEAVAAPTASQVSALAGFDRREKGAGAKLREDRETRRRAAKELERTVRGVRVDFDERLGSPAFIASTEQFLTDAGGKGGAVSPEQATRFAAVDHGVVHAFLSEHAALFGHGPEVLENARLARDYVTPHNGLRTTVWQQQFEGVRVFESTLQAHVTKDGALVNLASRLVPDVRAAAESGTPHREALLAQPTIDAPHAVSIAASTVGDLVPAAHVTPATESEGPSRRQNFHAPALLETEAEYVWLPINESSMRLCWEVIFTSKKKGEMFRTLVDAGTGAALVQQRLTEYIAPASYRVFTSDSPTPMSPGLAAPLSTQPPEVARSLVTLSALDTAASPNGWIDDGVTETRGNNVDAHLDLNSDNIADTPRPQSTGAGRVFDPPLDLTQAPSAYRDAAVVNLFYWNNVIHDRYYGLGFTEAAGNFQINNFGRGGVGNDAVQADAQDGSGTNNANFSTPPDGSSGRMQMYIFTGPTPDRDGDFDQEVVIHEYTHGLSNRLVGGGVGISALQPRGMGEGWSDFYALCLLSDPADNPNGTYGAGAYASYQLSGLTANYYYGIRRYPYCTDLTKNPLTFKDIDPTKASAHTGVPKSPLGGSTADEVHNIGEVWCVTLWDLRANLIAKHGGAAGNDLALRLVTDGMKLAPANPTFLQARDAIIQAELVYSGGADRGELWSAFAKRGMGAGATSPVSSTATGVVENYDFPDPLGIGPTGAWAPTGTVGGPFSATNTYTLLNSGAAPLNWTASNTQPWLSLSQTSGTLAAGASTTVVASMNAGANSLAFGTYPDTLTFKNTTTGILQQRPVAFTIEPITIPIFTETWESGAAGPAWSFTGTNTYRTLVATANGPHAGTYHLTMDSSIDDSYSRNEATLTVNLASRHNVQLRFWVKMFNDEPNGPPTSPFTGGADFDGVAISADGNTWYEVQPLRTYTDVWQRYVVDLDAAVAAHGLTYNSTFKVRFNHYDNYGIPTDGFAFDDIEVVELVSNRLTLGLPSSATEGDAPLTATLGVTPIPATDLVVTLSSSDASEAAVPASVTIPAGQSSITFPVTLPEDTELDGTQTVTIAADAPTFVSGSATLAVNDNETAMLALAIPATTTEGVADLTGTVSVGTPVDAPVVVKLTSSDISELRVPATVTISPGHSSAVFALTIVDDTRIDGQTNVTVSAAVANWAAATADITIADNEQRTLALGLPANLREGDAVRNGTVSIPGTLTTNLVISLSSSDSSAATVPATVTILAGQTTATVPVTVVDDVLADGPQPVTISATAAGFSAAGVTTSVADNDAHHFTISPISSTVLRNTPVAVTITAKDVTDATITNFNQSVTLSAADTANNSVPLTPTSATGFANGVKTLTVSFSGYGSGVTLRAQDAGGHVGISNSFDVIFGAVSKLAWDPIPTAQSIDSPFPVTIRAVDSAGNTVPTFTGPADLSVVPPSAVEILSWTAYADLSTGGEYANTKQAISTYFPAYHETTTTTSDPSTLAGLLAGKQVFLVVEQENSSSSTLGALGTAWSSVLTNFVNGGGTVIVCSNTTSEHLLLTNSGLLNASPVSTYTSLSLTKGADTPFNAGVTVPFSGSYLHTYTTTDVVSLRSATIATEAAVISRQIGPGRVVLIGTDFYTLGTGMDRVIANAVALAQPPTGTLPINPSSPPVFAGGEWSGTISVPFTASGLRLHAVSGALSGDSNAFNVGVASVPSGTASIFSEDFESGTLNPSFWTVTGTTASYRTQVTTDFAPHAGTRHLTMDCSDSSGSTYARNEATLQLNLAGRTGVKLSFWAKMFDDDPNPPPTSPFVGGADFDGVAISADGTNWYEVQSLRSPTVTNGWGQFTVDLDAAIAVNHLAYNASFKIRFNQYDNYNISTDGIAIDDITVTADVPPSTLSLQVPPQATEGAGVVNGSVTLSGPAASDTVLNLFSKSAAKVTVPSTVTIPAGQSSATFPLTVLDDPYVDGTKNVVITVSGAGYLETGTSMQILDNDSGTLSLTVPSVVLENAVTVTATLTASLPSLVPQTVTLTSSNPQAAQVPTTFTLPAGATTVSFNITIPDDGIIDGDQSVQITAAISSWTGASASLTVQDNETRNLTVTIPSAFREGDLPKVGTISLNGLLLADLVVTLTSSDTTQITVPASVTIPAGQASASFSITIVDDTIADGSQPFTITASAATYTSGTASGSVRDNEAHHFTFETIPSPQLAGAAVPALITARDPSGAILTDYNAILSLTATNNSGPLTVTPTSSGVFVGGKWNGMVQFGGPATNVVLTASDGAGHTGSSNAFNLVSGSFDHFAWDPIASPQSLDTPFAVRIRAVNAAGTTVPGFSGAANLFIQAPVVRPTIGTGSSTSLYPTLYTYSHDARSDTLYTASDLNGAARITGLSFNVTSTPSIPETLTNFTIRLKHTSLANLNSYGSWDNTGWTQVYRANPTISATGWITFNFTTPFDFNGTSNLLVDLSFDRTTSNSSFLYLQGSSTSNPMTVYGASNSTNGDPLTWAGSTPSVSTYYQRADVRFTTLGALPLRPSVANGFVAGEWNGEISVPVAGTGLNVLAQSGAFSGASNSFDVVIPPPPQDSGTNVFTENFESGALNSLYWTVSGTGNYRTRVATDSAPHAGAYHLTMDTTSSAARNEATLTLNLQGRSGVTLTFWAKMFDDDPTGPPPSPFVGGADFDGVAISADGTNWYEVQSLRSPTITNNWAQFTVNLDAAIAARGLAYGSTFKIRFNQYDDSTIPVDGIAIDDIAVTANPIAGFALTGPAQATEGAGTVNATVTLDTPAAADTPISLLSSAPAKATVPASVTVPAGQTSASIPINVLDDAIADGNRSVYIAGTLNGKSRTLLLTVLDNDPIPLNITAPTTISENASVQTGSVTLGAPASGTITVNLTSSDVTALKVPVSVIILPGQTSAPFTVTPVDDNKIDGPQTAVITASVPGWADVALPVQITDNETRQLSMYVPSVYEGATDTGSVSISGTLPTALVVTLNSSNPSQLTVPATVTIPAGATSVSFTVTPVDDTATDGSQSSLITASAPSFTSTTYTAAAYDNDIHHFSFDAISSAQVRGRPFSIWVYARDVNNSTITAFNGPVNLSASAAGVAIPMTPTSANFSGGYAILTVTLNGLATSATIQATDTAGHTGISNSFAVGAGTADHFVWSTVPSPANVGSPFAASVSAQDVYGNTVTTYNGAVTLTATPPSRTVGTGTYTTNAVFNFGYQCRAQCIYLASELGAAGTISGLSLNLYSSPLTATRFTIRIKPTTLSGYTSPYGWDANTGWTTVYQSNVTVNTTGWLYLPFSTPFAYDGSSNLLVDFSINNANTSSSYGAVYGTGTVANRTLSGYSYGSNGDPLTWTGTTPSISVSSTVPNFRLRMLPNTPVNPGSVTLASGIWNGSLSLGSAGKGLVLQADGATGLTGESNPFDVNGVASLGVTPPGPLITTGYRGGPFAPAGHPFTVTNTGSAPLTWTASTSAPWISLTSNGGTLAGGASTTVTANLDAAALAALASGTYNGSLTFTNTVNGAGNTTRNITVTATAHGDLTITPAAGGVYTLGNSGDSTLSWTLTGLPPWLTASLTSGDITPGGTATVTVSSNARAAQLSPGRYEAPLLFANATTGHGTATMAYVLDVPTLMQAEPSFTGGYTNTVQWTPVAQASSYEVQMALNPAFSSAFSSGPQAGTAFSFTGLAEGQPYYFRVRAQSPAISFWAQQTPAVLGTDTMANLSTDSTGLVLALTRGAVLTGRILNPSFEADASGATAASSWSTTNSGSMQVQVATTGATPLPSDGTRFANLWTTWTAHAAGEWVRISQTINLTDVASLNFDAALTKTNGYTWASAIRAGVYLDGTLIWSRTTEGAATNQSVSLGGLTGNHTLSLENYTMAAGSYAPQWACFDNLRLIAPSSTYMTAGSVISPTFTVGATRWGQLLFETDTPAGTALTVDVLDANNVALAAGVPNGADLGAIPALSSQRTIRLRANFSTTNSLRTPRLRNWAVTWIGGSAQPGAWSAPVSSIQDASTPGLSRNTASTSTTAIIVPQGGASDALSGVGSVLVNGRAATSNDGFATWVAPAVLLAPGHNTVTVTVSDQAIPPNTFTQQWDIEYTGAATTDADGDGLPDSWENAHGLNAAVATGADGPLGDFDRDGIPNVLEFALNLDPAAANRSGLPTTEIKVNPADGKKYLEFSYRRRISPNGISYLLETSTNCATWNADTAAYEAVGTPSATGDGETEIATVRLLPSLSSGAGGYIRLRVSMP